ncbi:LysR family transcriptional regulator [Agrobacterium vitis]|uniref:LysR family transcriptional regulator n=1 Tax=Agrobacterium vitis TaxID=373 RepID=A0AAE2RG79_AGRVI|nr:LysR family transcriptional regulator [Agrobacterium vitis]MBF2717666.1 LysR family transcriptional regulator [Agrobacterium vitis]MVA22606.1 LysR family transcriptional regulator [Agrobacterium vitis]
MRPILNYIQLVQLRQALIIAEEGSFIRAAKRLNTHYSQVSRKIRALEESVGISIFTRRGNGVTPTPEGADFLHGVRRVITDLESVLSLANTARTGTSGRLSIGFYISMLDGELCDIVKQFIGLYPEISVQFLEAPRSDLAVALNNNAIDVKISTSQAGVGDSCLPLWRERVLAALPIHHPLATKSTISWEDLATEKIILRRHEPGNELRDLLRSSVGEAPEMQIVHHDVGRDSLLGLVRKGDGVALVYETDTGIVHSEIAYREIQANGHMARVHHLAHWRSDNTNPVLKRFIHLLHERYIFVGHKKILR